MKKSSYLVRFDDICPSMNWLVWDRIEKILIDNDVKPILAVVPDNKDIKLNFGLPRDDFWARVRRWQDLGWAIGLHGYQHTYETTESGIVGINNRSEFAGLAPEIQFKKISSGLQIFASHKVRPDLWIAPGHSFDRITVDVLKSKGLTIISDGYFMRPVMDNGTLWIPQQLWKFRSFSCGTWTVCFHTNSFEELDIQKLEESLRKYKSRIRSLQDILACKKFPQATVADYAFSVGWRALIQVKRILRTILRKVI